MERAGVFIGVDKTGGLQRLNDAAAGARRMHAWALAQGMPDGTHAKLITDEGGGKVEPDQVYDAIKEIIDGPGVDQLLVYFAGHGVNINRSEQWLLTDAPARTSAAINLEGCVSLAQYCGIRHVVFISDACRVAPEGIQAQRVQGVDVFPNDPATERASPVDRFFACVLGRTAAEIRDQRLAAEGYSALYTSALLDALEGRRPELLKSLATEPDGALYLTPEDLDEYLQVELPLRIKAMGLEQRVNQSPEAFVLSRRAWLARLEGIVGTEEPTTRGRRRARSSKGSTRRQRAKQAAPETLRTVVEQLVQSAVEGGTASLDRRLRKVSAGPVVGADALAGSARQLWTPFGPDHFETECGIKVRGARLIDYCAPRAPGAILGSGGEVVRIDAVEPMTPGGAAAASALVCFDGDFDGDVGAVIPVFPGFIASLSFEQGELVDLAYEPSANTSRWQEYEDRLTEHRAIRAVAASALQHGRFRLQPEEVEALDAMVAGANGADPALALYAAYAYWDLQREDLIQKTSAQLRKDLGATIFDLALLGRSMPGGTPGLDSGVVPFVPLLSRGWSLLRSHRVQLHPKLADIGDSLRDSTWSLFGGEALRKIRKIMQSKEVR